MPHSWTWLDGSATPRLDYEFARAAHWIWRKRGAAKRAGMPFSEESITETILLDMATFVASDLKIISFNKIQEGKIGADWEWCFYDHAKGRYLRFLMQAKLLDDKELHYSHIDRYIGSSGTRQIDRLIETAENRGIPALYAFYNHLTDLARVPVRTCACHHCIECWGATVAEAWAVRDLLPDKSFDTLKGVSMPWLCLLCPRHGPADPIDRVLAGVDSLFDHAEEFSGEGKAIRGPRRPLVENVPPPYFGVAADIAGMGSDTSHIREKLAADNPGVDGVVLIDVTTPEPEA